MALVQSAAVLVAFLSTQPDFDAPEAEFAACRQRNLAKLAKLSTPQPLECDGEISRQLREDAAALMRQVCLMCSCCEGVGRAQPIDPVARVSAEVIALAPRRLAPEFDACRQRTKAELAEIPATGAWREKSREAWIRDRCTACAQCPNMGRRDAI